MSSSPRQGACKPSVHGLLSMKLLWLQQRSQGLQHGAGCWRIHATLRSLGINPPRTRPRVCAADFRSSDPAPPPAGGAVSGTVPMPPSGAARSPHQSHWLQPPNYASYPPRAGETQARPFPESSKDASLGTGPKGPVWGVHRKHLQAHPGGTGQAGCLFSAENRGTASAGGQEGVRIPRL